MTLKEELKKLWDIIAAPELIVAEKMFKGSENDQSVKAKVLRAFARSQIIDWTLRIITIALLLWVVLIYPAEKKACESCNQQLLCIQGMLKGHVCDPYRLNYTFFNFTNATPKLDGGVLGEPMAPKV